MIFAKQQRLVAHTNKPFCPSRQKCCYLHPFWLRQEGRDLNQCGEEQWSLFHLEIPSEWQCNHTVVPKWNWTLEHPQGIPMSWALCMEHSLCRYVGWRVSWVRCDPSRLLLIASRKPWCNHGWLFSPCILHSIVMRGTKKVPRRISSVPRNQCCFTRKVSTQLRRD